MWCTSTSFDRVSHKKFLHKMTSVGIHPCIIAWIQAFLKDRQYVVRVNNSLSEARITGCGVPQGGELLPVLFNIRLIY